MVDLRKVERWAFIPEFPDYMISDEGNVYSRRFDREIRTSRNTYGHMKVSLTDYESGDRYVRSVAKMVAEVFVDRPNALCNEVAILDGNLENVVAENLAWRPRWFVWKYSHQLKVPQPIHYQNLPVYNITLQIRYRTIVEAGMTECLLFEDVWRSSYSGAEIFPYAHVFEMGR